MHERTFVAGVMGICVLAACTEATSPATGPRTYEEVVADRVPRRTGRNHIDPDRFPDMLHRIARVRVEPSRVELRVGERFDMRTAKVIASDSLGRDLGILPVYDSHMEPGAAQMEALHFVRARAPGEATLTVNAPLWGQHGTRGPAPSATVTFAVRP